MTYHPEELVEYLSLSNLTQLRYVIDADALEVLILTDQGERVLYEGDLNHWVLQVTVPQDGNLTEAAQAFCRDMHSGTPAFQHEFQVRDNRYTVRCKTVTTTAGTRVCYGVAENLGIPTELSFRRASDTFPSTMACISLSMASSCSFMAEIIFFQRLDLCL